MQEFKFALEWKYIQSYFESHVDMQLYLCDLRGRVYKASITCYKTCYKILEIISRLFLTVSALPAMKS